jgi:toxin YoeB
MKITFSTRGWEDYLHWQSTDRQVLRRINDLIKETIRTPFRGTGKPEPLRHVLAGFWSRRITEEHRMVYRVEGDSLFIAQLRYHY